MEKIIIPRPLQIVCDDLGWFCPTDDRPAGGPSRTSMSRYHVAEDYEAMNCLGEQLGMRINCAFILGEWDPDNRLSSVRHLSKYGDGWNNSAHLDPTEMKKCADTINASPYIDVAVHGLLHGYYMTGTDNHDTSDYYYCKNKELFMIPEEEIRHRLDCFFDILKYYNINKEVSSFVPPSFRTRWGELSRILADYGIKYSSTIFRIINCEGYDRPRIAEVENGIITLDRNNNLIPWNVAAADFSKLAPTVGVFGAHWPNFLHTDRNKNRDVIDGAVRYFKACAENFGTVLSSDIAFAANQSLLCRYGDLRVDGDLATVDLSLIPLAAGRNDTYELSLVDLPENIEGAELLSTEAHSSFVNLRIKAQSSRIKIKI